MATYPLKNISIGGDTYKIPIPPVYVIKCSDSVSETSWTDWQAGGRTLATPTLYKDGVQINDWSELTPDCNVSFELTADDTNYHTFKLSEVTSNPGYGSSSYQFEYIGSEAGSLPDSFAYIVRIGFFDGNMTSKKGYRVPLAANGGGGGGALHTLSIYKNGDEIALTNLAQSDTVELLDISTSTPVTLDNTGLTNIISTSPVVIKDVSFYAYVSSWNTSYKELSLIYANSTQMYELTLSHQWNANWQVSSNKRLMTQ